jgi:hypothetical protein
MSEITTNGQQDAAETASSGSSTSDVQQIADQAASGLSTAQQGSVHAIVNATAQLADVNKANPQDVAAGANNILTGYYSIALRQSQDSFRSALGAAIVGAAFFLLAVAFLLWTGSTEIATVSSIGGAVVEVIAGLNFYLYGKTTAQLDSYRRSLEQTQRFLLANSIAETLGTEKEETRADLVDTIAKWGGDASRSQDKGRSPSRERSRDSSSRDRGSPDSEH